MESLTSRESQVVQEVMRFARRFGRWPTVREVSRSVGDREGKPALSLASTFRKLTEKGILRRSGRHLGVKGYLVRIVKAEVIRSRKDSASADALSV